MNGRSADTLPITNINNYPTDLAPSQAAPARLFYSRFASLEFLNPALSRKQQLRWRRLLCLLFIRFLEFFSLDQSYRHCVCSNVNA